MSQGWFIRLHQSVFLLQIRQRERERRKLKRNMTCCQCTSACISAMLHINQSSNQWWLVEMRCGQLPTKNMWWNTTIVVLWVLTNIIIWCYCKSGIILRHSYKEYNTSKRCWFALLVFNFLPKVDVFTLNKNEHLCQHTSLWFSQIHIRSWTGL